MKLDYSDRNAELGRLFPDHVEIMRNRHDHALEQAGASHAVIFSGAPKYAFFDDNTYPFRANPHFVSWAPLTKLPLSYIVHTPGETPILIYYQPHDYWHPVPGAPEGYWTGEFDIRIVRDTGDVAEHLPEDRDKCVVIGEIDDPVHAHGIERINPTTAERALTLGLGRFTIAPFETIPANPWPDNRALVELVLRVLAGDYLPGWDDGFAA